MKKRTNLIIIVILAILLIIEIILVKNNYFNIIDNYVYSYVAKFINPVNTAIFKFFAFFGSEIFIIGLIILVPLLYKKKGRGVGFAFTLVLCLLFNQALKLIVARHRPEINVLVVESNYSFPSGHTMIAVTILMLLLSYLWSSKRVGKKVWKIVMTVLLVIFALLIMLSRIYLGVHYFSDIIGGITAALLLLAIIYYYYSFKYKVPYFPDNKNRGV